jgi:hypothetical protein
VSFAHPTIVFWCSEGYYFDGLDQTITTALLRKVTSAEFNFEFAHQSHQLRGIQGINPRLDQRNGLKA